MSFSSPPPPNGLQQRTHTHTSTGDEEAVSDVLMQQHLRAHAAAAAPTTFVTWAATLHPENATVSMDPRYVSSDSSAHPWKTVYDQTRAGMAVATAEEVPQQVEVGVGNNENVTTSTTITTITTEGQTVPNVDDDNKTSRKDSSLNICSGGNLLEKLVGFVILISTVSVVLSLEVACLVLYLLAVFFARTVQMLGEPNICTSLLVGISGFLWQLFAWLDVFLFLLNILSAELMAVSCAILCGILGCSCLVARAWHQLVRKISHWTRWAFRVPFESWKPPRSYPFSLQPRPGAAPSSTTTTTTTTTTTRTTVVSHHPGTPAVAAVEPDVVVVEGSDVMLEDMATSSKASAPPKDERPAPQV